MVQIREIIERVESVVPSRERLTLTEPAQLEILSFLLNIPLRDLREGMVYRWIDEGNPRYWIIAIETRTVWLFDLRYGHSFPHGYIVTVCQGEVSCYSPRYGKRCSLQDLLS